MNLALFILLPFLNRNKMIAVSSKKNKIIVELYSLQDISNNNEVIKFGNLKLERRENYI